MVDEKHDMFCVSEGLNVDKVNGYWWKADHSASVSEWNEMTKMQSFKIADFRKVWRSVSRACKNSRSLMKTEIISHCVRGKQISKNGLKIHGVCKMNCLNFRDLFASKTFKTPKTFPSVWPWRLSSKLSYILLNEGFLCTWYTVSECSTKAVKCVEIILTTGVSGKKKTNKAWTLKFVPTSNPNVFSYTHL